VVTGWLDDKKGKERRHALGHGGELQLGGSKAGNTGKQGSSYGRFNGGKKERMHVKLMAHTQNVE
jgi:hypothetical protein